MKWIQLVLRKLQTGGETYRRTEGRTDGKAVYISLFNFVEAGGGGGGGCMIKVNGGVKILEYPNINIFFHKLSKPPDNHSDIMQWKNQNQLNIWENIS